MGLALKKTLSYELRYSRLAVDWSRRRSAQVATLVRELAHQWIVSIVRMKTKRNRSKKWLRMKREAKIA